MRGGGDVNNPDLILKDFYSEKIAAYKNSYLVGQHENGAIYHYVPESADKAELINTLMSEQSAPQVLGGEEIGALWEFDPRWLLGLVPLAILPFIGSGSGSGSGLKSASTAPT
ncbi:hypothetical protein QV09_12340, partial [Gallibacterium salpingitidis]